MQVTHSADFLTHAVINAGEQLGFGVSDDPMFFQMLYSSLYSNPIRAAIREPLCNAWDANIDNGMGKVICLMSNLHKQCLSYNKNKGEHLAPLECVEPRTRSAWD